jgi:hypothetical protein
MSQCHSSPLSSPPLVPYILLSFRPPVLPSSCPPVLLSSCPPVLLSACPLVSWPRPPVRAILSSCPILPLPYSVLSPSLTVFKPFVTDSDVDIHLQKQWEESLRKVRPIALTTGVPAKENSEIQERTIGSTKERTNEGTNEGNEVPPELIVKLSTPRIRVTATPNLMKVLMGIWRTNIFYFPSSRDSTESFFFGKFGI